jgi:hypothetical protein
MTKISDLRWRSALVEGFAVLLGITLAFSIDAWWDLRSQRLESAAYLYATRTELEANRRLIVQDLETIESWIAESAGYLNNVVAKGANPSYDAVRTMVWRTGPNQISPLLRAAIDDLISSGGVTLVESPELRRSIAQYIRVMERDAGEQEDVRQAFIQSVLPYHLEHASFAEYEWEEYVGVPATDTTFELDREAFVENRSYANLLISRMLGYANLRDSHKAVLANIDATLSLIDDLGFDGESE